jgi:hypothetical protein
MRPMPAVAALVGLVVASLLIPEARTDEPDPAAMLLPPGFDVVDTAVFLDPAVPPPMTRPDTGSASEPVVPEASVAPSPG